MVQLSSVDDIIVVGRRPQEPLSWFNAFDWWMPIAFKTIDLNREVGQSNARIAEMLANAEIQFELPRLDLSVTISATDWAKLSDSQKYAISETLKRWDVKDSPLASAIRHLDNAEVNIVIRVSQDFNDGYGNVKTFAALGGGDPLQAPFMNIGYRNDTGASGDRTDVTNGSTVYININEDRARGAAGHTYDSFAMAFIHELLHPVTPNINNEDHDRVVPNAARALQDIFQGKAQPANTASLAIGQSMEGTYAGETFHGTSRSDFILGMGGNDILHGGGGSNAIFGGPGNDSLYSTGIDDLLSGGDGADNFYLLAGTSSATIVESGGYDRVWMQGFYHTDLFFERLENDLIIASRDTGQILAIIRNQFDYGMQERVEEFNFGDGSFGSWYIEELARGSSPGNPNEYYPPIILDIDRDGIVFTSTARTILSESLDGSLSRLTSWVDPEDAILVYDRDHNGTVTNLSEISFASRTSGYRTDLEGLASLDTDGDGAITDGDRDFSSLMLWFDRNGDGRSERGELIELKKFGIDSIGLETFQLRRLDRSAGHSQTLGFSLADGFAGSFKAVDVAFFQVPADLRPPFSSLDQFGSMFSEELSPMLVLA